MSWLDANGFGVDLGDRHVLHVETHGRLPNVPQGRRQAEWMLQRYNSPIELQSRQMVQARAKSQGH